MQSFYFEKRLKEYFTLAFQDKYSRILLFKLSEFHEELLSTNDEILIEIYTLETAQNLLFKLDSYSAYGLEPVQTQRIIDVFKESTINIIDLDLKQKIQNNLIRIQREIDKLQLILSGKEIENETGKLSFPVLEKTRNDITSLGMIEEIEVSINPNKNLSGIKFFIVPSLPHIEEKLNDQIQKSWNYAINYINLKYKKFTPNLEISIKFVNKFGIYEGDSLGVALTIGFIKELLRYYDFRDTLSYENNVIITGSVEDNGKIGEVGNEIIKSKVETVFYSLGKLFFVPQKDYSVAEKKLNSLLKIYPNRVFSLIPIREINDIIMRRDALRIERQNFIKWSGKKILKNKISVTLLVLFIGLLMSIYYVNFDDNPSQIEITTNRYLIKNKSGKLLWYKDRKPVTQIEKGAEYSWNRMRIMDVDNDNVNEVFLTYLLNSNKLLLFNKSGKEIWSYEHFDSITSKSEIFTGNFQVQGIIDTISQNGRKVLFTYVQHNNYYPNGIICLDLETGKKVNNILWNSGAITGAILEDWNEDGKKEIIAGGASNGMNSAFLFSIDADKLEGTSPTSENYLFQNVRIADYNKYYIFEQTDYGTYFFPKYCAVLGKPDINNNLLNANICEGEADIYKSHFGYSIRFDKKMNPVMIVIGDEAVVERDRYVKQGKLKYPFTDTEEFHDSIMNKIKYWNGEKFVKYSEQFK